MVTVNINDAGNHLSALVERAVRGETFVISRRGIPIVKVTAFDAPTAPV